MGFCPPNKIYVWAFVLLLKNQCVGFCPVGFCPTFFQTRHVQLVHIFVHGVLPHSFKKVSPLDVSEFQSSLHWGRVLNTKIMFEKNSSNWKCFWGEEQQQWPEEIMVFIYLEYMFVFQLSWLVIWIFTSILYFLVWAWWYYNSQKISNKPRFTYPLNFLFWR